MKLLLSLFTVILFSLSANSQTLGKDIKKGAKTVGNKTAQVASKGAAGVKDKKVKDKMGPNGQTIYIDNHSKYYFIDTKGKKHYVNKNALKKKTS